MDILKKLEGILNLLLDFVMAVVKGEFPELSTILGSEEEKEVETF